MLANLLILNTYNMYVDNITRIRSVSKDTRRATQSSSNLLPAGRAFRKQWGRGSEQIADKVSRKYPLLTAPIGILYFLFSKNGK